MAKLGPIQIERSLAPVGRADIDAARHTAILAVMRKMKFDAIAAAIKPSSAYTTGEITGRLRESIKVVPDPNIPGLHLRKGNTEIYQLLQDQNETPVEGGGRRGYGWFQERGTGPIRPKTKKWLHWTQTAKYHFGRRAFTYRWRLVGQSTQHTGAKFYNRRRNPTLSKIGAPYRGRNVVPRFRSAIMTDIGGKGKTATANLFVTHDIFASETQGLKAKHYLENAWNKHTKELGEVIHVHTTEMFDEFIAGKNALTARRKAAADKALAAAGNLQ